jgi:hypothetical protein
MKSQTQALRSVRSMAARMFARNAYRKPERAEKWLAICDRYEAMIDSLKRKEAR